MQLEGELRSGSAAGSRPRLPSIRQLCRRFGASKNTVSQALMLLRERGLVERDAPQRGFFRAGSAPLRPPSADFIPQQKREAIGGILREEIQEGAYADGISFLSLKEVKVRFHCSHGVARDTLEELARQGLLQRIGRSYTLRGKPRGRKAAASCVHFIGIPHTVHSTSQALSVIGALERELQKHEWGKLAYHLTRSPEEDPAPPETSVSGFVFLKLGGLKTWEQFLQRRSHIPLIAIDQDERLAWTASRFPSHKRFHSITFDNERAGREVGLHLAQHGHRHIAFISHLPLRENWSGRRLRGLREICGVTGSGRESVYLSCFTAQNENPGAPIHSRERLDQQVRLLNNLFQVPDLLPSRMVKEHFQATYRLANNMETATKAKPLFEAALDRPEITAWVCINDDLAALAWKFLERRGKRVPGDISLIGFDNSPLSYCMGLGSYDMGYDKAGILAFRCLSDPATVRKSRQGVIRVHGQLISRPSVGPAPGV